MSEVRYLPTKVKVEVLHRIWAGEKITHVASECGISRQVIYTWKRKAEEVLYQALEEKKRGPKPPRSSEKDQAERTHKKSNDPSLSQKRNHQKSPSRKSSILLSLSVNHKVNHKVNVGNGRRPERCPVCGCEKIYKNGTYIRKVHSNGHKGIEIVQRYICVWCKSSLH